MHIGYPPLHRAIEAEIGPIAMEFSTTTGALSCSGLKVKNKLKEWTLIKMQKLLSFFQIEKAEPFVLKSTHKFNTQYCSIYRAKSITIKQDYLLISSQLELN